MGPRAPLLVAIAGLVVCGWAGGDAGARAGRWCGNCTACFDAPGGRVERLNLSLLRSYQEEQQHYDAGFNVSAGAQLFATPCGTLDGMPAQPAFHNTRCADGAAVCECSSATDGRCRTVLKHGFAGVAGNGSTGVPGVRLTLNGTGPACPLVPGTSWSPSLEFRCDFSAAGFRTGHALLRWDGGARNTTSAGTCSPKVRWATSFACPSFPSPVESRLVGPTGQPASGVASMKAGTAVSGAARFQVRDQFRSVAKANTTHPPVMVESNCTKDKVLVLSSSPPRLNSVGAVPIGLTALPQQFGFTNRTCQVNVSLAQHTGAGSAAAVGRALALRLLALPRSAGPVAPLAWVLLGQEGSVAFAETLASAGPPLRACRQTAAAPAGLAVHGTGQGRGREGRAANGAPEPHGEAPAELPCAEIGATIDGLVPAVVRAEGLPAIALWLSPGALSQAGRLAAGDEPASPGPSGSAGPRERAAGASGEPTTWLLSAQWCTVVTPAPLGPQGPQSGELVAVVLGTVFGVAGLVGVGFALRGFCCDRAGGFRLPTTWRRDAVSDRSRGLLAADGTYVSGEAAAESGRAGRGKPGKGSAAPGTPRMGSSQPLWDAERLDLASRAAGFGATDQGSAAIAMPGSGGSGGGFGARPGGVPGVVRSRLRGSSGGLTSLSRGSPDTGSALHSHGTAGGRLHPGAAASREPSSSALAAATAERLRGTGLDARALYRRGIVTDAEDEDEEDDDSVLSIA